VYCLQAKVGELEKRLTALEQQDRALASVPKLAVNNPTGVTKGLTATAEESPAAGAAGLNVTSSTDENAVAAVAAGVAAAEAKEEAAPGPGGYTGQAEVDHPAAAQDNCLLERLGALEAHLQALEQRQQARHRGISSNMHIAELRAWIPMDLNRRRWCCGLGKWSCMLGTFLLVKTGYCFIFWPLQKGERETHWVGKFQMHVVILPCMNDITGLNTVEQCIPFN
jgi:hypothetical protein